MIKSSKILSLAALVVFGIFVLSLTVNTIPQASALPVSYNQTALNFGLTSVPRNSSSYDVFPLIPDNWLWEKFDNNTIDSSPLGVTGTVTYNTNLKALFKFENNVNNSTGTGNGTVVGTTTYVSGHEGQGFSFNGATYIKTTNTPYQFGKTDSWSVSFWLKTSSTANQMIINKGAVYGGGYGWSVNISNGYNTIQFLLADSAGNYYIMNTGVNNLPTIANGAWHHIVITYNGGLASNSVTSYLDGVSQTTSFIGSTISSDIKSTVLLRMGASQTPDQYFTGVLDEVRIYSGIVLSQAQVSALYEVGHYSQSHTFDGGEYVTLSSNVGPLGHSPVTVSTWINPASTSGAPRIYKYGSGPSTEFLLLNGKVAYYDGTNLYTSTNTIPTNSYSYIAWVISGSTNLQIYINGVLDSSQTIVAKNTAAGSNYIGNDLSGSPFIGQIDNLKVYPYALSASQITSDYNSISPISSGKQFMSWYNGISGSSTLTKKLGYGSTTTLLCNLNTITPTIVSNMSNIYYECGNAVKKFDIVGNTNSHVYTSADSNAGNARLLFMGMKNIFSASSNPSGFAYMLNSQKGNVTQGGNTGTWVASNQQINVLTVSTGIKFNYNTTNIISIPDGSNLCNINYNPSNLTKKIDSIACDQAVPAMAIKYWNGMLIQGVANYATNSTQQFLSSIDASPYRKLLSLPCTILVNETPCTDFILTDFTNTDYLIVLTSTHVYYQNAQTALAKLQNNNYALQSYDVVTVNTSSNFELPNPLLQDMTLYGFNLNTTVHKTGLFTLPSGYSIRTTTVSPSIRLIDPRWSNDNTDIPIISTTSSLFPISLTVSNAPPFAAIKVTQGNQIINTQESVWSISQLDSTRSVEFDLPAGTCANTYIADISVAPSIWNFEGIICATGLNQKTISYTNTLPISFWTSKYSATDSYTPSSGTLTVTTRATTGPYTENILIKNSNGTIAQNYTATVNGTIDTPSFNVTTIAKPLTLDVNINGQTIYSAFLGSSVSFASVSSFFATYFSYHGFNLLSLIPLLFAGMFTRNSVGIGAVAVVLLIASLNFFSLVVIPEATITIMLFISLIGLIAYRVILY